MTGPDVVRVLVVEDEELAAEAHAAYVARVPGFTLAGVARSAGEAVRLLERDPGGDLLLLDMHLPDGHGLGLLQRLRATGNTADVIAVTSARDSDVVRRAVREVDHVVDALLSRIVAGSISELDPVEPLRVGLAIRRIAAELSRQPPAVNVGRQSVPKSSK